MFCYILSDTLYYLMDIKDDGPNGMAVLAACEQLSARLKPFHEKLGADAKWVDVVKAAYMATNENSVVGIHCCTGMALCTSLGIPLDRDTSA